MQRGEQHVLFQAAGVRLHSLQNARVKGMHKIAITQKKANYFRAPLENAAGLSVGAETQAPNGLQDARARFPANLGAGIQHPRNRSYAHARGPRYIANCALPWNCFHAALCFLRLLHLASDFGGNPVRASLAHLKRQGVCAFPYWKASRGAKRLMKAI
jgi:hypothetical protein